MSPLHRLLLLLLSVGTTAALLWLGWNYHRAMRLAYTGLEGRSEVIDSRWGAIEYRRGGRGLPVLVVHGSGGGFDQGELIAQALLGDGFDWIAPSRFGYLRSSLPVGASFDEQAHAYAALLDRLGIERVAVLAMSHGGPSALLFAALHPQRVSSLTLVSCGVATSKEADQADADRKGNALTTVFSHDPLYWAVSRFARGTLLGLMGVDEAVTQRLDADQHRLIDRVIDAMNPVAPRSAGVVFDNRAALPNGRLEVIRTPTLILHARDDGLQRFHNAQYALAHIAGAQLQAYDHGGHLLIAVELPALRAQVQAFIRASALPAH